MRIAPLVLSTVLAGCSATPRSESPAATAISGPASSEVGASAQGASPGPGGTSDAPAASSAPTATGAQPSSPAPTATGAQPAPAGPGLLSGQVLGRDGAPAAGAKVDVLPHSVTWNLRSDPLTATVQTGPDGRFQVGPLPPGGYGIAATLVDGTVVFGPPVEVRADSAVPPVALRAEETPITLRGTVVDEAGRPLAGAAVRVVRPVMPFDAVAVLPPLSDARFQVLLPAGEYNVVASAPGFPPRMQRMSAPLDRPAEVRLERATTADERRAAVAWMRQTAVPLKSVEAGQGFEDLRKLLPVLKDVRVVGLGEATHGSREFFQLKHRMLEFLASELGFTVLALEAGVTESRALNDYVLTGKGDPGKGLGGLIVYPWQTEELLELVQWMRRYNADPSHRKKLKFHGVDMQIPSPAATQVGEYLRKVDAAYAAQVAEPLALMAGGSPRALPRERQQAVSDTLAEVARRLDDRRAEYSRRSTPTAWALARQDLTALRQYVAQLLSPEDTRIRDRAMADNLRWALEHEGPGTKAVFWAHNMHVARGAGEWTDAPAGRHLRDAFGPAFYVFGLAFNQGAFQAMHAPVPGAPGRRGVAEFTVPPAPEDSLDAALASTGLPLFALDLRAVPPSGPVREWWRRAHATRDPGAFYSDAGYTMSNNHALELYDGLLFVERTTRARPLPWIIQAPK
jgi:erythromycin esterase